MSDERDRGSEDQEEATRRMAADEHTSTFDPFADDDEDVEATRAMPADAAATRAMPAGDEVTQKVTPQIWAARASVPVPDVAPVPDPAAGQWQEEFADERADHSWLRPVVIALVVLILLGMLAIGLWLIFSRTGGRSAPSPTVAPTVSGLPAPTGAPSVTGTPTGPATTAAAQVAVPDLVGQSEAAARQQLTANGLTSIVSRRAASGVSPGTVIATEPGAGTMVAPGSRVTLIVAAAAAPTTPTPSRSTSPTPGTSSSPNASAAPGLTG